MTPVSLSNPGRAHDLESIIFNIPHSCFRIVVDAFLKSVEGLVDRFSPACFKSIKRLARPKHFGRRPAVNLSTTVRRFVDYRWPDTVRGENLSGSRSSRPGTNNNDIFGTLHVDRSNSKAVPVDPLTCHGKWICVSQTKARRAIRVKQSGVPLDRMSGSRNPFQSPRLSHQRVRHIHLAP